MELLCNNGAILNQGRLVFHGRWTELATGNPRYRLQLDNWEMGRAILEKCGAVIVQNRHRGTAAEGEIADLVTALVVGGVRVSAR